MDVEGGNSSAIFFFLGAAILLTLVSWSERREPNVRKSVALVCSVVELTEAPVETYSNVWTIWIRPVLL